MTRKCNCPFGLPLPDDPGGPFVAGMCRPCWLAEGGNPWGGPALVRRKPKMTISQLAAARRG